MHRIAEEQENELRLLVEQFRENHADMRIEPRMIDLTHCFKGSKGVRVPRYWYSGSGSPSIKAYVVRDGPIIKKYDARNYSVRDGGRDYQKILDMQDPDFIVSSMLCVNATRNTYFSEVSDFKREKWNPAGLASGVVWEIEDQLRELSGGDFNVKRDNAFIFARGSAAEAEGALRLNAIWLSLIARFGEKFFEKEPTVYEIGVARSVLPEELFNNPTEENIKRASYQWDDWGKKSHTKESEWFLAKMVERYIGLEELFSSSSERARLYEIDKRKDVLEILEHIKSRGDSGVDLIELDDDGFFEDRDLALSILFVGGKIRCVVQDRPRKYNEKTARERFFDIYRRDPYYRIYDSSLIKDWASQGKVVEAVGSREPHYIFTEQPAVTA